MELQKFSLAENMNSNNKMLFLFHRVMKTASITRLSCTPNNIGAPQVFCYKIPNYTF
jgi:hypothetical protein